MEDPLHLLHLYASGERKIKELTHDGVKYLAFGDLAFPHDVKTNLRVYSKDNEYYTLESLLLLWEKQALPHSNYVKEAGNRKIRAVSRPDRREILEYLKGERKAPPASVDSFAPIPPPIPVARLQSTREPERKRPKIDENVTSVAKHSRIDVLLNEGAAAAAASLDERESSKPVRALNDDLTPDKILALKNKIKLNQRHIVAVTDEDHVALDGPAAVAATVAAGAGAAASSSHLGVSDAKSVDAGVVLPGGALTSDDFSWRDRNSCLDASVKKFSALLQLLQSLKMREEVSERNRQNPAAAQTVGPPTQAMPVTHRQQRATGYSRYDQEIYNKEHDADMRVDTVLTFVGSNLSKAMSGGQAAAPLPKSVGPAPNNSSVEPPDQQQKPRKRTPKTPIILIPAAGTSLVTMYNVIDMLQDMRFVSTEEKKSRGCRRDNEAIIQRKKPDGTTVPYRVVDNPLRLSNEEWDRVVAVFVMGPAWQFKGWRWGGNPVEIFAHIAAFHVCFDDARLDPNVAKWSVNMLRLSRNKRHLDKATLVNFWTIVDRHIVKHKADLRY